MPKTAVIEAIRSKVGRLVDENRRLLDDLGRQVRQGDGLRAENRELKGRIAQLEKRVGQLELQGGLAGGSGDTKAARGRVNRLLREVDKCIALLNK